MKLFDEVYGIEEVYEPIILELLECAEMQRLKGVSQFGFPQGYYPKRVFSRYEHSVGVFILLRRLKASLKEQIAGLLHDVSHTAFSHVIDWTIGNPIKADYQDNTHKKMVEQSNIPRVLEKHGFDYEVITQLEKFPLLERPLPELCADRIDYTLREIKEFIEPRILALLLDSLVVFQDRIAFQSEKEAQIFARAYARCQREHWAGDESKARYHLFAEVLRRALKNNIICLDDLHYKTDSEIIDMLTASKDAFILNVLKLLKNKIRFEISTNGEGILLLRKPRSLDPAILTEGKMKKLSELSREYRHFMENEMMRDIREVRIRLLDIDGDFI